MKTQISLFILLVHFIYLFGRLFVRLNVFLQQLFDIVLQIFSNLWNLPQSTEFSAILDRQIFHFSQNTPTMSGERKNSDLLLLWCSFHSLSFCLTAPKTYLLYKVKNSDISWHTPYLYLDWSFHVTASLILMLALTELMKLNIINWLIRI